MIAVGEPLPDPDDVEIPEDKLRLYALNPEHGDGAHKARVFEATLGITQADADHLRDGIRASIREAPITDVRPCHNGTRCTVIITVHGLNDRVARVTTGWRVPTTGVLPT